MYIMRIRFKVLFIKWLFRFICSIGNIYLIKLLIKHYFYIYFDEYTFLEVPDRMKKWMIQNFPTVLHRMDNEYAHENDYCDSIIKINYKYYWDLETLVSRIIANNINNVININELLNQSNVCYHCKKHIYVPLINHYKNNELKKELFQSYKTHIYHPSGFYVKYYFGTTNYPFTQDNKLTINDMQELLSKIGHFPSKSDNIEEHFANVINKYIECHNILFHSV